MIDLAQKDLRLVLEAAAFVLVGAAPGEAEWAAAGKLGAYLPAEAYFTV